MKPLAPNTTLQGRYTITRLIGKGGMGEVYLAVDTRLGHSVALKRTTVGDDAVLAEAFEQEARTLAQLRHPVLPNVSDHFIGENGQFLVMDYIDGEDLAKRLKSSAKPFPLNWVLFWADQLLEALGYLHKHDPPIIHRDIKPQNLKLTKENQIILLDFGLSKRSLGDTQVTSSGSVVGYTPHYAPMEQIRGTGTNASSDIYSLSATLYQLLTGTVPADALTRADALLGGSPDPLKPLTELNTEISDLLSSIILRGMDISQDKRYPTAREMQKELRKAFNQLQESMSAETVAFNLEDEGIVTSDAKTEVISDLQIDESAVVEVPPSPVVPPPPVSPSSEPEVEDFSGDKTEVIDASEIRGIASDEDFQSTMKKDFYVDEVVNEPEILKTEAYSAEEIEASQEENVYETKEEIEDIPHSEEPESDTFSSEGVSSDEDFSPEATVPLISLDNDVVDSDPSFADSDEYDSKGTPEEHDVTSAALAGSGAGESESDSVAPVAAGGKSSTGKYIAILGGLGLLFLVLVVSAAGVAWYVSNGGFQTGQDGVNTATPSPSVEPTVEETPIEESTPETSNTDVFGDNTNSNSDENSDTSNSETNMEPEDPTTPTKTSTPRATRTPVRRSTPVSRPTRRPTPRPTRKPTRKPTPKPTKKPKAKDPGILQ